MFLPMVHACASQFCLLCVAIRMWLGENKIVNYAHDDDNDNDDNGDNEESDANDNDDIDDDNDDQVGDDETKVY